MIHLPTHSKKHADNGRKAALKTLKNKPKSVPVRYCQLCGDEMTDWFEIRHSGELKRIDEKCYQKFKNN